MTTALDFYENACRVAEVERGRVAPIRFGVVDYSGIKCDPNSWVPPGVFEYDAIIHERNPFYWMSMPIEQLEAFASAAFLVVDQLNGYGIDVTSPLVPMPVSNEDRKTRDWRRRAVLSTRHGLGIGTLLAMCECMTLAREHLTLAGISDVDVEVRLDAHYDDEELRAVASYNKGSYYGLLLHMLKANPQKDAVGFSRHTGAIDCFEKRTADAMLRGFFTD